MRFLFFFIHPAYFHVFRNTINLLKQKGHKVDIVITSKDVLEELVLNEGWNYKNIFPNGRKIKWLPTYLSAFINLIVTIIRIEKYIFKKKYDLFVTDDLIGINGFIHSTPTILFQDDDVTAVPESFFQHIFSNKILSPRCSNMGFYNYKKIPFDGFKELGYLHPNKFNPDYSVVKRFNPSGKKYFVLRLVSLLATHDVGAKGLDDENVLKIISKLEKFGNVFITSERQLPEKFEKYRLKINVNEISNVLYFAEILISDSQTMSAESAILGTPYLRYNDFVGKISYLNELENKYELGYGFKTNQKDQLFDRLDELLSHDNLNKKYQTNRLKMIEEKVDLTDFMIKLFENYPRKN